MKQNRPKGFTLLEMLVVLVIAGLVSTVLTQALSQIYKLHSRFSLAIYNSQQTAMELDWYRQIIQGLQADYDNGQDSFFGKANTLNGLTTTPASLNYGATTRFRLELEYDRSSNLTMLNYSEGEKKQKLLSWAGKNVKFSYIDQGGEPHETWPPALGKWPKLPKTILLQASDGFMPYLVAATPRSSGNLPQRPEDMLGK